MLAGERIIFAPSYCTIEENVFPVMKSRRVGQSHAVSIPPREMAGLILDNRHFTIRSKIINWKMYRIDRVDQFYYVLDNDTMLGRQIPVAVVAFRPTRVPREPVAFWDYGIVSEVCPGCRLSVIGDSDDFLMMELRGERTMSEQFQLGWMDKDEVARDLTVWTTKDQRDCGEFPLVLHRADLPANLAEGEKALDDYYRDVMRRVAPKPLDYRDHYIWRDVINLHSDWQRRRAWSDVIAKEGQANSDAAGFSGAWQLFELIRTGYRKAFGRVPEVGRLHPQWVDLHPVMQRIHAVAKSTDRALSITGKGGGMISPRLDQWIRSVDHWTFAEMQDEPAFAAARRRAPYDLCFLELLREELLEFGKVHAHLRKLVRKGGTILVFCRLRDSRLRDPGPLDPRDFRLISGALPAADIAELRFAGGPMVHTLQALWDTQTQKIGRGRAMALLSLVFTGLVVGPLAALANWRAARRPAGIVPKGCTSLLLEVTVV